KSAQVRPRTTSGPKGRPRTCSASWNLLSMSTSIMTSLRAAFFGADARSRSSALLAPSDSPAIGGTTDTVAITGAARATRSAVSSCCTATPPDGGYRDGMTDDRTSDVGTGPRQSAGTPTSAYVELHCHSAFSLLDGAALPELLIARAADLGYRALAL